VRSGVDRRRRPPCGGDLGDRDLHSQGNSAGNLAHNSQQIAHAPIVDVGPEVRLPVRLHELRRHMDPVAVAADASLEHEIDVELAGDLGHTLRRLPVTEGRGPRDDSERLRIHARERRDHFLDEAVARKVLLRIACQIAKRQHHEPHRLGLFAVGDAECACPEQPRDNDNESRRGNQEKRPEVRARRFGRGR
jgi:hypothetical protein